MIQELPDDDKDTYLNDDNTDFNIARVAENLCEIFADVVISKTKLTVKNVFQQVHKHDLCSCLKEGTTEFVLAQVVSNVERQKALKKEANAMEKALHNLTKITIEGLSDEEVRTLLYEKWIHPLQDNLLSIPEVIIENLTTKVLALAAKYETGIVELEQKIVEASSELSAMLDELTGSEFDMLACSELKNTLANGVSDVMKFALLEKMFPKEGEMTPQVRFKGFVGEWKKNKLSEITQRVTRKNEKLESKLALTISAHHGLIAQEDFFSRRIASTQLQGYFLIKKGEFAYNKSYSSEYPVGAVKCLTN